MASSDSLGTVGQSTETLGRGAAILNGIAEHGVIKQETPEDETAILQQIEAMGFDVMAKHS